MSEYEMMNAFDFKKVLESLPSEMQGADQRHRANLEKIEADRRAAKNKNDADLASLDGRVAKIVSEITACKEKIYHLVRRDYVSYAGSELRPYVDEALIGDVLKPGERELPEAEATLRNLFAKKRNEEGPTKSRLLDEHVKETSALNEQVRLEDLRYENEIEGLIGPVKAEYGARASLCAEAYNAKSVPNDADTLPDTVVLGNLIFPRPQALEEFFPEEVLRLPVLSHLWRPGSKIPGNIIINISTDDLFGRWKEPLEDIVVGLILRWFDAIPCDSLRVGIFSSVFSSLEKLSAFYQAAKKGNITIEESASNQTGLTRLLRAIKLRGDEIDQKIYNNSADDIFSLRKSNVKEPMHLIVLQDVFREMTEENLRDLYDCLRGYRRCGFRFIIVDDFNEEIYTNKSNVFRGILAELRGLCRNYYFMDGHVTDGDGNSYELARLESGMDRNSVYEFCTTYCSNIGKKGKESVSYERIGFGKDREKAGDWNAISIPIGLDEPDIWHIDMSCQQTPPIANLVVGVPGTGKSSLIDAMILNGAIKYSPDELNFQLLDFKDGISSSVYIRPECRIPHIKVVSQENKPEDAGIILSNIMSESERRNEAFKQLSAESGIQIRNIADYNMQVAGGRYGRRNMPRLVIVIDECQCLFDNEVLAKQCETIVRKCRAQGIHLILATQSLSRKMWNTIKFVDGRYCFEIAKEDAEQLLDRKYVPLIETDVPKGSYMAFASNDGGKSARKIKMAFYGKNADNSDRMSEYAKKIREKWSEYPIELFVAGDKSPCPIDEEEYLEKTEQLKEPNEIVVPLGVNYGDSSTITMRFREERMNSVLLVGSDAKIANNICFSLMLAASAQGAEIAAVDASKSQSLKTAAAEVRGGKIGVYPAGEYTAALQYVWEIYSGRIGDMSRAYEPVVFIVNGLQRINGFLQNTKTVLGRAEAGQAPAKSMDDFDDINEFFKYTQQQTERLYSRGAKAGEVTLFGRDSLMELLSNGYKVNVYMCLAMDSVDLQGANGEPVFNYSQRHTLANSDYKILFNDVKDCSSIMDASFKGLRQYNLNEHMAFMAENTTGYYKFRVYEHETKKPEEML